MTSKGRWIRSKKGCDKHIYGIPLDAKNQRIFLVMAQSTQRRGAAIVTGASQGMGREIALRLAQDGFSVAVNDLPYRLEALKEVVTELSTHGRAIAVPGDVGVEADVQALIEKTVTQLGDLEAVSDARHCRSIFK
jgi:hypothetical protein